MNEVGVAGGILNRTEFQHQSGIYANGYLYPRVFDVGFGSGELPSRYGQADELYGPVTMASFDPFSINQIRPAGFIIDRPVRP